MNYFCSYRKTCFCPLKLSVRGNQLSILETSPFWIAQFRYIKIQLKTLYLNTRLRRINTEFVAFIPQSLVLSEVSCLINAFSLMNASYLINAPLCWQVCIKRPSLTNAPCLINAPLPWNWFRHRRGRRWKYHGARRGLGCWHWAITTTNTLFRHFVCTIYRYGFVDGLDLSADVRTYHVTVIRINASLF